MNNNNTTKVNLETFTEWYKSRGIETKWIRDITDATGDVRDSINFGGLGEAVSLQTWSFRPLELPEAGLSSSWSDPKIVAFWRRGGFTVFSPVPHDES